MEKSLRNGVILVIITGCTAFIGALFGSAFQSYLMDKQKKSEEKRVVYGRMLGKMGMLPISSLTMLNVAHFKQTPYTGEAVSGEMVAVEIVNTWRNSLKNLPPEKLLEIKESMSSANLIAGEKLSSRLTELTAILEGKEKPLETPMKLKALGFKVKIATETKIAALYKEILSLAREEISN